MKTSVVIDELGHLFGMKNIIPLIKDAGFELVDYGSGAYHSELFAKSDDEIRKVLLADKKMLNEYGLEVGQMHAPFPSYPDDPEAFEHMIYNVSHSLRAAEIMECPYVVMHGALRCGWEPDDDREATRLLNVRILENLLPVAEETGVKLAFENMPCTGISTSSPEEIIDIIDTFKSKYLVACLDTGHANMTEVKPAEFARLLGHRLEVLHIHDNMGNNDSHLPPYCGNIDWHDFSCALHEIGFDKSFSLETTHLQHHMPFDILKNIFPVENMICRNIISLWSEA